MTGRICNSSLANNSKQVTLRDSLVLEHAVNFACMKKCGISGGITRFHHISLAMCGGTPGKRAAVLHDKVTTAPTEQMIIIRIIHTLTYKAMSPNQKIQSGLWIHVLLLRYRSAVPTYMKQNELAMISIRSTPNFNLEYLPPLMLELQERASQGTHAPLEGESMTIGAKLVSFSCVDIVCATVCKRADKPQLKDSAEVTQRFIQATMTAAAAVGV